MTNFLLLPSTQEMDQTEKGLKELFGKEANVCVHFSSAPILECLLHSGFNSSLMRESQEPLPPSAWWQEDFTSCFWGRTMWKSFGEENSHRSTKTQLHLPGPLGAPGVHLGWILEPSHPFYGLGEQGSERGEATSIGIGWLWTSLII